MFHFFKKKEDPNIYAPVQGKCMDISEVKDEAFSSKLMGDGVAVIPEGDTIMAPADGKITMLFETGHAFGMELNNGMELLIHIGIDTVNLNGEGFTPLKRAGDKVKKGDAIIKIDLENLKKTHDLSTMVIVTSKTDFRKLALNEAVDENTAILEGTV